MSSSPGNNEISLSQKLDEISEGLVFTEPDDLQALGQLHNLVEQLAAMADGPAGATVKAACAAMLARLNDIMLERAPDAAKAMEAIGKGVSALQSVLSGVVAPDRVEFPAELGVAPGPAASEPAEKPAPEAKAPAKPRKLSAASSFRATFALPAYVDEAIFSEFLARQHSVLEELEELALGIERAPAPDKLDALRRLVHTLKGEAGLLGLADMEKLCHAAEDAVGQRAPDSLIDPLLEMKDWLGHAVAHYSGKGPAPAPIGNLLAALKGDSPPNKGRQSRREVPEAPPPEAEPAAETPAPAAPPEQSFAFEGDPSLIGDFVTESAEHLEAAELQLLSLETDSENQEALNAVFRAFHTIKGVAGFVGLSEIQSLAHISENLLDKARKGEASLAGGTMDVVFDAVDSLKRLVAAVKSALAAGTAPAPDAELPALLERLRQAASGELAPAAAPHPAAEGAGGKRLGELVVEMGVATSDDVDDMLRLQSAEPSPAPRMGEMLVREHRAPARDVAMALRAQREGEGAAAGEGKAVQVRDTVKVDAERLDRLVDMIGELVIAESMVSQAREVRESGNVALKGHLDQLDKITRELQEMGASLRLVPVRATFQKMARLVRDLAKKSNKPVEFLMSGEDTELDKTVVDRIGDPLVHMVRNSVDHGLEATPEERVQRGKPAAGKVTLRAFHRGGSIFIEIEDDGRGLDVDAILAKARERGLAREGETLSEREIYSMIFQPGFSTAKKITDVSGRGVGMDVVRRNIEELRGTVEIKTERGKGTTFSIGRERYILPTLSITTSLRPERAELATALQRGEMLKVQGRLIPLFRLSGLFGIPGAEPDPTRAIIVVVESDGKQAGLLVDELLGQQQIVIKSLGEMMSGIPGIAGGAIMPDGAVGLILDVSGLVSLAHRG
ncbi:MAG: Chemotaxis protein CheA [candidate division BRC1 bacterium ADurb.BinA364]|nr:MAG: Chemotaxis protein CheA [candidate division BRC1 bacterium ADurb.BinA364]